MHLDGKKAFVLKPHFTSSRVDTCRHRPTISAHALLLLSLLHTVAKQRKLSIPKMGTGPERQAQTGDDKEERTDATLKGKLDLPQRDWRGSMRNLSSR